jgi:hypothetical protein
MVMVLRAAHRRADVVEQRRAFQELAIEGPEGVEGFRAVEDRHGEPRHVSAVGRIGIEGRRETDDRAATKLLQSPPARHAIGGAAAERL